MVHLDTGHDADPLEECRERLSLARLPRKRLLEHDDAADAPLHTVGRDQQVAIDGASFLRRRDAERREPLLDRAEICPRLANPSRGWSASPRWPRTPLDSGPTSCPLRLLRRVTGSSGLTVEHPRAALSSPVHCTSNGMLSASGARRRAPVAGVLRQRSQAAEETA